MKNKKNWILRLICFCIGFSLMGCAGNPQEGERSNVETGDSSVLPWACGGVAWFDGWFTIWVSEDDSGRIRPVVAQIDEEYLEELQTLSGNMEIEVRLTAK